METRVRTSACSQRCVVSLSSCNTENLQTVVRHLKQLTRPTEPTESHPTAVEGESSVPKRSYRFVSDSEAQEIIELYATGLTAKAVGEKVGRNPRTITDTLRKHGVDIRSKISITGADIRVMVRLHESGQSCTDIATQLGVSRASVYRYLCLDEVKYGP